MVRELASRKRSPRGRGQGTGHVEMGNYWRDDTHWSPAGVRVAAEEIAARLAESR